MHPYIPHLLTDIAASHRSKAPEERLDKSEGEEYREVQEWAGGETAGHTFGYYCGLKSENFPPAEQLTDEEMNMIRKAFEKMMCTWNHGIELPDNLPIPFAYKMTVGSLDMQTTIVETGILNFHFCKDYPPNCIFKEFCACLKTWNKKKGTSNEGAIFLAKMMTREWKLRNGEDDGNWKIVEDDEPF